MKILYLHQYFITPDSAGGTRSYEMARRLVAAGHEVHMITSDGQGNFSGSGWRETNEAGIHVHWSKVRYSNHMGFARRLIAFSNFALKSTVKAIMLKGDIIFATSTPLTIAFPALLASSWNHLPFVFEVRDMWPDVPIAIGAVRNRILKRLARWLELTTYKRSAHIIALAPGMREDIIAKGIPAEKVSVIPNGCDLDVFSAISESASPRHQHAWLCERKLVIYAGTVGRANGVDYLVRLAREVAVIDPEIRFVVFGGGREWEAVYKLAHKLGIIDRNFFMFASLPKKQIASWLRAADVHVALMRGPRSYLKDAVNNKFFDALAAGKPIANNFDGWQSRIAEEAGVGLIIDPEDIPAAAQCLVEKLHDEEWLRQIPGRARELAEGRFSRDRLALQLEAVLTAAWVKAG
jgi:glycosyltransferase involved in cell wall biosynthesis